MKFIRLEADNFKSFAELRIDLDGHGFVKIDGVNNTDSFSESVGSGKSSIADAISYALIGETVKGNSSMNDVKNMYTDGVCRVAVTFEHNGHEYTITRGEAELSIVQDGENISKHLKRETQELIEQMFPFFTPTFIGATVIIGQNMPNAFTNNKPSARKQILEELTNSSFMIEEIKAMLAERKQEWQTEIGKLQTAVVVEETKISQSEQSIARAKSKMAALRDTTEIESDLVAVRERIEHGNGEIDRLRGESENLTAQKDKLQEELNGLTKNLDTARVAHSEWLVKGTEAMLVERAGIDNQLTDVRGAYSAKKREINKLVERITELEAAPTHCPTCGQALPDAHKIDTTALHEELDGLRSELDGLKIRGEGLSELLPPLEEKIQAFKRENQTTDEIESLKKGIEEVRGKLSALAAEIQQKAADIRGWEGTISKVRESEKELVRQLSEVDTVRTSCQETIEQNEAEIAESEKKRGELNEALEKKQAKLGVLNQVISFATRDFRTILLSSIIKRLDAYAKSYCKKMLETTEIEFKDDGNNIAITYRGRDFGVLSGGESQVVKMCITLALKKTLEDLVGFTTNLVIFDEVLDNCDVSTARQIVELVSSLDLSTTLFISHHQEVYLPVDQTWTVTKTDRISSLSVSAN